MVIIWENKFNIFVEMFKEFYGFSGIAVVQREELIKKELDKDYLMKVTAIFKEKKYNYSKIHNKLANKL